MIEVTHDSDFAPNYVDGQGNIVLGNEVNSLVAYQSPNNVTFVNSALYNIPETGKLSGLLILPISVSLAWVSFLLYKKRKYDKNRLRLH